MDTPVTSKTPSKDDDEDIHFGKNIGETDDDVIYSAEDVNEYPQELMRTELVSIMEQRFLAGEDTEFFDYESRNPELDKIRERDLEDAYFDDE